MIINENEQEQEQEQVKEVFKFVESQSESFATLALSDDSSSDVSASNNHSKRTNEKGEAIRNSYGEEIPGTEGSIYDGLAAKNQVLDTLPTIPRRQISPLVPKRPLSASKPTSAQAGFISNTLKPENGETTSTSLITTVSTCKQEEVSPPDPIPSIPRGSGRSVQRFSKRPLCKDDDGDSCGSDVDESSCGSDVDESSCASDVDLMIPFDPTPKPPQRKLTPTVYRRKQLESEREPSRLADYQTAAPRLPQRLISPLPTKKMKMKQKTEEEDIRAKYGYEEAAPSSKNVERQWWEYNRKGLTRSKSAGSGKKVALTKSSQLAFSAGRKRRGGCSKIPDCGEGTMILRSKSSELSTSAGGERRILRSKLSSTTLTGAGTIFQKENKRRYLRRSASSIQVKCYEKHSKDQQEEPHTPRKRSSSMQFGPTKNTQNDWKQPGRSPLRRCASSISVFRSHVPPPSTAMPQRSSMKKEDPPSCRWSAGIRRRRRRTIGYTLEDIEVTLPDDQKVIRRRSISFHEQVETKSVTPLRDLTDKSALFFQKEEYRRFRQKRYEIVKKVKDEERRRASIDCHSTAADMGREKKLCIRGLEGFFEKNSRIQGIRDSVLNEQGKQKQNGYFDDEVVAKLYSLTTEQCRMEAAQRAQKDQNEIYGDCIEKRGYRRMSM